MQGTIDGQGNPGSPCISWVTPQDLAVVISSATELASPPTSTPAVRICDRRHNLNKGSPHFRASKSLRHIEGLISLDEHDKSFLDEIK
jgi:hypothetical protein